MLPSRSISSGCQQTDTQMCSDEAGTTAPPVDESDRARRAIRIQNLRDPLGSLGFRNRQRALIRSGRLRTIALAVSLGLFAASLGWVDWDATRLAKIAATQTVAAANGGYSRASATAAAALDFRKGQPPLVPASAKSTFAIKWPATSTPTAAHPPQPGSPSPSQTPRLPPPIPTGTPPPFGSPPPPNMPAPDAENVTESS
jgi:hypothetical protein